MRAAPLPAVSVRQGLEGGKTGLQHESWQNRSSWARSSERLKIMQPRPAESQLFFRKKAGIVEESGGGW